MQDFGTKSDNTAGPSGQLSAAEFNNLATELENSVLRSGQALNGASVTQLAISLFLHAVKSDSFQDSGAANAYVATPVSGSGGVMLPADYAAMHGTRITFQASNANSGASTLNIGQTTGALLGTKAIVDQAGAALASGAIIAGFFITVRYDSTLAAGAGAWVLMPWATAASQAQRGIIEIANTAETQAWVDALRAITPAGLNTAFQGANQSLTTNGFQKIPGTLKILWGSVSTGTANPVLVTLPLTLPSLFLAAAFVPTQGGGSPGSVLGVTFDPTLTNFNIDRRTSTTGASSTVGGFWIVIGA